MHDQQNSSIQDTIGELEGYEVGELEKDITAEVGDDSNMTKHVDVAHKYGEEMGKGDASCHSLKAKVQVFRK